MTSQSPVVIVPNTFREREIARCLAIGYTWAETATVVGCSLRTVAYKVQQLHPYVRVLKDNLEADLYSGIYANLALALDVERRMLTGEIPHTDGRYVEARRIVSRIVDRLFIVDRGPQAPPAGPADPPEPGQLQLTASAGESPAPSA